MLWKFKKIYQETNIDVVDPIPNVFSALISNTSQVDPSDSCNLLTLDNTVYIQQQNTGFITVGDIVYIDSLVTSPFMGDGNYYKIKASNTNTYTAQVDSFGVILSSTGFGICI
jgi:hypothetical protein